MRSFILIVAVLLDQAAVVLLFAATVRELRNTDSKRK
jgi:hypothetical protein